MTTAIGMLLMLYCSKYINKYSNLFESIIFFLCGYFLENDIFDLDKYLTELHIFPKLKIDMGIINTSGLFGNSFAVILAGLQFRT